jgi:hypothetical protein
MIWQGLDDFVAIELLEELFDFVSTEIEEGWISVEQVRDLFTRAIQRVQFDFKKVASINSESCYLESIY